MTKLEQNFRKFKKITNEEALIAEEIRKHSEIDDLHTVLDVGCADGALSKSLVTDTRNITFLDIDEFDFSPQEKFIRSSFEDLETSDKFDRILSSHVWGHFYRNDTFEYCFEKAIKLLNDDGMLLVVHNSNNDFIGELIGFAMNLFDQIEFDVFLDSVLNDVDYKEHYFDVELKANSFGELAELIQVLLVVPDDVYYPQIERVEDFLQNNLESPAFNINQRLLVINK